MESKRKVKAVIKRSSDKIKQFFEAKVMQKKIAENLMVQSSYKNGAGAASGENSEGNPILRLFKAIDKQT